MSAAEEIQDSNIRHSVYLERYSRRTVRQIVRLIDRLDARIVARINASDLTEFGAARLQQLLDGIREINQQAHVVLRRELREELDELAVYEAGFQVQTMRSAIPVVVDTVIPAAAQLRAAVAARPFQGRLLRDWFDDLEASTFRLVRDEIRMGFVEGRTTPQIVRAIRGTRRQGYRDGIAQVSRRRAEAAVRTAINHTANVARETTYSENADLIKGVKWVSTLDGRTSAVCRARDGQVYDLDKGPRPPAHPNCRSTTTPVLKSWRELGIDLQEAPEGTRASMDGQVPSSQTYNSWLRKQPVEFQNDVLGETKGKLYRDGGLSLDRFVDASGDEYTLDELRRREPGAFEKAGLDA